MHPILLLSSIILGSTSSVHPDVLPNCDGLIEPSVLSIERRLDNIEEKRGASVTLRCSFYSAPQPTIIWYHRGKKIDGHLAPNFESLLTTTQLGQSIVESSKDLIDCLDESTSGEYFCEATSPCSPPIVTSSIVTIRKDTNLSIATKQPLCKPQQKRFNHSPVNSAPIIADFTISRLELPGGVAQLACRARGYPTPKVSWKRIEDDDSLTSISGLSSYMQLTNGDLLVVGDESTISESFRCSATRSILYSLV